MPQALDTQQTINQIPQIKFSVIKWLALLSLYATVLYLSLQQIQQEGFVAALWPCNALLLSAALRQQKELYWLPYVGGGFVVNILVNMFYTDVFTVAVGFALCNFLEIVISLALIRHFYLNVPLSQQTSGQTIVCLVIVGLLSPALSALAGATLISGVYGSDYWTIWSMWWVADALGMMICVPLCVSWSAKTWANMKKGNRLWESLAIILLATSTTSVLFTLADLHFLVLVIPILLWSALRLRLFGCALTCWLTSVIAVILSLKGYGPVADLARDSYTDTVQSLQLFFATTMIPTLMLAIIVVQYARKTRDLSVSESRYKAIYNETPVMLHSIDAQGCLVSVSDHWLYMMGYSREEVLGRPSTDFLTPASRERAKEVLAEFYETGTLREVPYQYVRKNGEIFDVSLSATMERDKYNRMFRSLAVSVDVTDRNHTQIELRNEKELLQVTLESIGDGVITTNTEGHVEFLNPVAEGLTGWSLKQARGKSVESIFRIVDEATGQKVANPVHTCLETRTKTRSPQLTRLISAKGETHAIQNSAAPIVDPEGAIQGVVMVFQDVSESRQLMDKIAHQASHDSLTGLLNRREFENRLKNSLASCQNGQEHHVVCYLDLDKFKIVNDTAGHVAGDALLKQISQLLLSNVRNHDSLARIGGDEFGLLLESCPVDKAVEIAEHLVKIISEIRFAWNKQLYEVGVSIGLVAMTSETKNIESLLSHADIACFSAKGRGRNQVVVYELNTGESAFHHKVLQQASRLRQALEEEQFFLCGQPIFSLKDSGEQPAYYEILLRLRDREGRIVSPGAFIPAAERYDLMPAIDRWVVETSLVRYAEIFSAPTGPGISVNLSGASLNDKSLLPYILKQLDSTRIPPHKICFEITETIAINSLANAKAFVTTLRERGCRIALDDFGSGYCSVLYLKQLPVDYVKIDGSFVRTLMDSAVDRAVVESINQIGQLMGLKTIAESVENDVLKEHLKGIGVDMVQGFSIGPPILLDKLLGHGNTKSSAGKTPLRLVAEA